MTQPNPHRRSGWLHLVMGLIFVSTWTPCLCQGSPAAAPTPAALVMDAENADAQGTPKDAPQSHVTDSGGATSTMAQDAPTGLKNIASLRRPFELPPWPITLGGIAVLLLGLYSGWRLGRRRG